MCVCVCFVGVPEQVVALNRQILDEGHPGVADSLSDLAELCRAQGKLDEVGLYCVCFCAFLLVSYAFVS